MTTTQDGCATSTDIDRLELAGRAALMQAEHLWHMDVYDPKPSDRTPRADASRKVIDSILTAAGWGWRVPYAGDGVGPEWCGLTVAACWRAAGINPWWLATYFASTFRLDTWARYENFDDKHPNRRPITGPYRLLSCMNTVSEGPSFVPCAGDILMIGDGMPEFGDHICLVESYDADKRVFSTYEGNGVGLGPDGKRRQGIVRGERHVGGSGYCARRLIRPAPSDLLPEIPRLH